MVTGLGITAHAAVSNFSELIISGEWRGWIRQLSSLRL